MSSVALYRPIADMQREVDRLFDRFFTGERGEGTWTGWTPRLDLVETEDHFVVHMDLPGLTKEDVEITFQEGVLQISGERELVREGQHQYHRLERWNGPFSRSLRFGRDVNPEGIEAHFEEGVLTIRLKKAEERKPRRIEIS